ncbi:hypothetical protein CR513_34062, partial [Mucuna pruriens]
MTGDMFIFLNLKSYEGTISFRGSGKGNIVGTCKVGKHSSPTIKNVLYVDGLKYNLLSISQFCNSRYAIKNTMMKDRFGIKILGIKIINMSLMRCLKYSVKEFKIKKQNGVVETKNRTMQEMLEPWYVKILFQSTFGQKQ